MKKVLAAAISVILALALPAFVLAADVNNGQENGKDVKIKEISMEVTGLPDEINEGDEVVLTFIVPRSGSKWEYGDMSGLLEPETYFDEETCSYVTMAMIDTASAGPLEIIFEFIMTAGKSHVRFSALYENTMEISGTPVKSNIIYYWNQDFTDNFDGWNTGGSAGSITLDSGAALFEMGYDGQGPYSFFEGSNADWTGDWYSSIKVFLDPGSFTEGLGFDYITAINEGDSTFLDSYGFSFISGTSSINASCIGLTDSVSISSPGWYTLLHRFYDNGGVLFVDMKIIASDSSVVLFETINTGYDILTEVGGSRYARFSSITEDSGILADDFQRYSIP